MNSFFKVMLTALLIMIALAVTVNLPGPFAGVATAFGVIASVFAVILGVFAAVAGVVIGVFAAAAAIVFGVFCPIALPLLILALPFLLIAALISAARPARR